MSERAILRLSRVEAAEALTALYGALRDRGYGAPSAAPGQLIRPLLAIAGAEALGCARDAAFWTATAAVQLAHEASLLHDDVIDEAAVRRGKPTLAATRGVAGALVEGDHLLTTAYRLAAGTGSPGFIEVFAHAVERTVAGEKLQGRVRGLVLDERAYRRIIAGKSGELLGCALASAAYLEDSPKAPSLYVLGRRVGELYQMLDDLLDYCPDVDTGKAPLGDYSHGRWTWPLLEVGSDGFALGASAVAEHGGFGTDTSDVAEHGGFGADASDAAKHGLLGCAASDVAERLASPDAHGTSPLRRCLARFERSVDGVRAAVAVHMPADEIVTELVEMWLGRAAAAVDRVEAAHARRRAVAELQRRLPASSSIDQFFATNSRTFSFAARSFPREVRGRVAALYAFCRVTDEIADGAAGVADDAGRVHDGARAPDIAGEPSRSYLLDVWRELAHDAYAGRECGLPLLDRVMREAALAGVPFAYVDELIEGMRMDLIGRRYDSLSELRVYSYRVAGVVGQWVTRLWGVHDDAVLDRAADLGHALQLTNILRDVGEDLRAGRLYLPADALAAVGLDERVLNSFAAGAPVTPAYRSMLETLMARADAHYAAALAATPALPPSLRRGVVIAAHVYRGIHDEIRANDYDNFGRRARTSGARKLSLALRALGSGHLEGRSAPASERTPSSLATAPRRARRARGRTIALLVGAAALPVVVPATVNAQPATATRQVPEENGSASTVDLHLDAVRTAYFVAVDDGSAIDTGRTALMEARAALPAAAPGRTLLLAYEGAFTALEAKHGSWPIARFLKVRSALQLLDAAVAAAPDELEIRYLHMINTFHLPSLFGRAADAARDMAILERALPAAASRYTPVLYREMVQFVLDHGSPAPEPRDRLLAALAEVCVGGMSEGVCHD